MVRVGVLRALAAAKGLAVERTPGRPACFYLVCPNGAKLRKAEGGARWSAWHAARFLRGLPDWPYPLV